MKISPCIALKEGQNLGCEREPKNNKYQLAIFYPMRYETRMDFDDENYRGSLFRRRVWDWRANKYVDTDISLTLQKRIIFEAHDSLDVIKGGFNKTSNEFGYSNYEHRVTIMVRADSESQKRQITGLDNGLWKVILFNRDKTGELYGNVFGLKTIDYEYDGDYKVITLSSVKREESMPLFYSNEILGDEILEDAFEIFDEYFDDSFE